MRRFFYRNIFLPAFEGGLKGRKTFRYWAELERSQWLPRSQIEQLQFDALQRLIAHASANCPYYREEWIRLELGPRQLRSLEDFHRWPIIGRDVVRENRLQMRAQVPGMRMIAKSTGGSTGVPLHFDLDAGSLERRMAAWHRGYSWAGAAPGTRQLYLWGVPAGRQPAWRRLKDHLYHRLYRRVVLNTFELSEERMPQYLRRLNSYRPDVIVAYAHSLYTFARSLGERGLRPFSPKSIVVGAEKLYPFQRELIEKVFEAPVFETYGSREFMLMSSECDRHEGMHLTAENLLVEVLDNDGRPTPEGEQGNVVVTDLYNYGMPFVRYTNGDRAVAGRGACSCGRGLPLLREVVGRRTDIVHTPDGRHITGLYFPHLIKEFPAIKRFLVVQDRPDHVDVRLVLGPTWSDADRRLLDRGIRDVLGTQVHFDITPVDEIPPTSSGKQPVVLNLCGPGGPAPDSES
jgi:phenylacetate-CoA ligase